MTFWMTYLNSTLNPFVYALSSKEMRQAIVKILFCRNKQEVISTETDANVASVKY